jgi:hypothetical protein
MAMPQTNTAILDLFGQQCEIETLYRGPWLGLFLPQIETIGLQREESAKLPCIGGLRFAVHCPGIA